MAKRSTKPEDKQARALQAARRRLEQRLLRRVIDRALTADSGTERYGFENIVGVGIGEKLIDGRFSGEPAIIVYVVAKKPTDLIDPHALVPPAIDNLPTDVIATGEIRALPFRGRYRPAPGGVSIGHHRITAGTLGCLVQRGRQFFVLSNNHVLANSNEAAVDDAIRQPGRADGGGPTDVIATLAQWVLLRFGGQLNQVDCAIGRITGATAHSRNQCFGRIQSSPVACRREMLVKKCGRTTQLTRGRITDCDATIWVNYEAGRALFEKQIIIVSLTSTGFSDGGDSGSLIVTDDTVRPVGLLFAGSVTHTIANPIGAVLSALNVTIVS